MMLQIAFAGVAIALAAGFIVWTLARGRRPGMAGTALVLTLAALAALQGCELLVLLRPAEALAWRRCAAVVAAVLPPLWLLYALTFGREGGVRHASPFARLLLVFSPAFGISLLLLPFDAFYLPAGTAGAITLATGGYLLELAMLLVLTFCLVQLEHTLASTPPHRRWAGKFELLGFATLLVGHLICLSQGLLQRSVGTDLLPVRSLALAAGVVLIAFSRLRRGEAVPVRVSPEMAFRSVVFTAVALYLVCLGVVGEGMRYVAVPVRQVILLCTGLAGGVALAIVFLSETMKRKIRVFLHKHFYANKYDYREEWQRFTRQLSLARSQEELFGAILAFYRETFALQGSALFLRDAEHGSYRAEAVCGLDLVDVTLAAGNPLVDALAGGDWIFSTGDEAPRVPPETAAFLACHRVSFVVPLHFDRTLEGFILLGQRIDRREETTYEDFDLMKMLARQAASTILSVRLADQLANQRELAAMGKVSAFVLHDLKNLASGLALVVDNARTWFDEPEFRHDMVATLGATVGRMKELIVRLQNLEEKKGLDLRVCDLREVVHLGGAAAGAGMLRYGGAAAFARVDREEMHKVALNLILNALEAGEGGTVRVETGEEGRAFFRVRDQGCGMSEEFVRTRLFRPFQSTKRKGFGIGLYQCRSIVEAHGGEIEVRSEAGKGSEFTVWLPRAAEGGAMAIPAADPMAPGRWQSAAG